jgi:hypothetical protein
MEGKTTPVKIKMKTNCLNKASKFFIAKKLEPKKKVKLL